MTILCYGDSNTFGFDPRSSLGGRYDADCRWVDILAAETGWEVRNNGMNGREIPRRAPAFSSSADLLVIMLGTNDLLQGCSAAETAVRMENFLSRLAFSKEKILLIAPPPLSRGAWVTEQRLVDESAKLAGEYRMLAGRWGVRFLDAGEWEIPMAFDGVHFTEEGNRGFAREFRRCLAESAERNRLE